MGLPAEGMQAFYRNSMRDIIKYFCKFHNAKVKLYNLLEENSMPTNKPQSIPISDHFKQKYSLTATEIPVAYFPMQDHNPGSLE
jgi:hypothetical protein